MVRFISFLIGILMTMIGLMHGIGTRLPSSSSVTLEAQTSLDLASSWTRIEQLEAMKTWWPAAPSATRETREAGHTVFWVQTWAGRVIPVDSHILNEGISLQRKIDEPTLPIQGSWTITLSTVDTTGPIRTSISVQQDLAISSPILRTVLRALGRESAVLKDFLDHFPK